MATKKTPAPKSDGLTNIICTCDRLPLESGEVLVRDQTARVPVCHADNYAAAGRAKRG